MFSSRRFMISDLICLWSILSYFLVVQYGGLGLSLCMWISSFHDIILEISHYLFLNCIIQIYSNKNSMVLMQQKQVHRPVE